jgi:hypothetical protein
VVRLLTGFSYFVGVSSIIEKFVKMKGLRGLGCLLSFREDVNLKTDTALLFELPCVLVDLLDR